MSSVVDSPAGKSLKKIGLPLAPVEALNALRATAEVKCTKKRGEPCIATQQVIHVCAVVVVFALSLLLQLLLMLPLQLDRI